MYPYMPKIINKSLKMNIKKFINYFIVYNTVVLFICRTCVYLNMHSRIPLHYISIVYLFNVFIYVHTQTYIVYINIYVMYVCVVNGK